LLEQVRLSLAGFARWISKTNSLADPVEIAPAVWNLGEIGSEYKFVAILVAAQPLQQRVSELLIQRAGDELPTALLVPGTGALPAGIGANHGTVTRLSNVVRSGKIDLKILSLNPPKKRVSNEDLSRQLTSGLSSIKRERIVDEVKGQQLRSELADMAGDADEFLSKLITGFGKDAKVAQLFMLLRSDDPNRPGKHLTFEQVGKQLKVTKQAISLQYRKMAEHYPAAHRYLEAIRAHTETQNYSEMSPTGRRKAGIDESYGYDKLDT
jgi:hypothetical protein